MTNILKPILKKIITPNRAAFVLGRLIQDNIIVAHEAFHFLNLRKRCIKKYLAFKIDLNRAYDRVEWDFLIATMHNLGFNKKMDRLDLSMCEHNLFPNSY